MPDKKYPGPESIHRHILTNGLIVLAYQNTAAESVVLEGFVRAGALVEPAEKAGLASFTADMLMRGTASRDFETIYEGLESVGASLHFGASRHGSDFAGRGLAEDLDLLLALLADSLRQPTFPEEQVDQVKGEILTMLQMRANDPGRMAALAFREKLYQDHPYGRSVDGYEETIEQLTADDLRDFHRRYYGPRDMILTVVGALKPAEVVAKIAAALGDWQPDQEEMPTAPPARRPESRIDVRINMPRKSQADIVLGLPGPPRSAPDYLDASLANTILGVFGMMGRLGQKVREEQGLAYTIFSELHGGLGPSPWYVGTGVAPENVEKAIASILGEIERIQHEPVPTDELADSQAFRTGSLPVGLETNDGLAEVITDLEFYNLGLDYLQKLPAEIEAITPERIQAAAQKYLSSEQIVVAVAGPDQHGGEG